MDYSVALIIPSTVVCQTATTALQEMNLSHPIYAASQNGALKIANELIPLGTKIIISHGITYDFLRSHLDIPMMELPFTGLEAAAALRTAFKYSDKVIHMGTQRLFHYLQESARFFGMDESRLHHYTLSPNRSMEEQTQDVLSKGYDVIIGGFPTVNYAKEHGKFGVEFDVDKQIITVTIRNARNLVQGLMQEEERTELNRAILQASSDGLIAIDQYRNIFSANLAAERIIRLTEKDYLGQTVEDIFKQENIIDIHQIDPYAKESHPQQIQVLLNELPVMVRGEQKGSVITIKKVTEIQDLEYQIRKDLIVRGLVAKHTFDDIIGESPSIHAVKEKAHTYAQYDSTVLIVGETGTGKELFAQSIHRASPRKNQPFVAINCATLPENLIESELFGYVKGAFTGANQEGKKGLFEIANNGTIFLDEISEIPMQMQAKLLRVLQEGEIIRVGGDKVIRVNVRVICSSNQDLETLILEKKFKSDLFYRLNVLDIHLPPLRERREDIIVLAQALLSHYNVKHNKYIQSIAPVVQAELKNLDYLGNVRELRNMIERMVLLCKGATIDWETYVRSGIKKRTQEDRGYPLQAKNAMGKNLSTIEKESIYKAIAHCNGNKSAAAHQLGISPSTLWRKLKAFEAEASPHLK